MRRTLYGTLAATLLAAGFGLGPATAAADTVAAAVFEPGRFAGITSPVVLRYRFEMRGQGIETPKPSPVRVEVRSVAPDGGKEVWLDLFEGPQQRHFGPVAAREQNPLVITFLQMDVNEMGRLTGGASGYFQQQIRRAFNDPAETEAVTIELDGRSLPATRLTLRPFQNDPAIDRFPAFRAKAYVFTVADGIPGGVWQLVARVPDPADGRLILEKSLTFEGVETKG